MEDLEGFGSGERVDGQVGETGVGAADRRKGSGQEADVTAVVVGVSRRAGKDAVDEEAEIAIVDEHEEGVGGSAGGNRRRAGRIDQENVVAASIGIVAAEEKFALAGDLEIVKLVDTLAVENACVAALQQGKVNLNRAVAHHEFCIEAGLEKVGLVDQHVIASILEGAGFAVVVPRAVITTQAVGEQRGLTGDGGSSGRVIGRWAGSRVRGSAGRRRGGWRRAACRGRPLIGRGAIPVGVVGGDI